MDYSVKLLNAEYSSLLEGYSGLFIVRLANLCVKSNPISLIPVIVDHPLGEKNIEEVADASVPDDDHIDVYPKLEDDIFVIGKGILEAHPEFKMSVETMKNGDEEMRYLHFTMPKVDKNRRDVLLQAVDACYNECKSQLDENKMKYEAQLAEKIPSLSKEDADKAKEDFNNTYKANKDIIDTKNKEKIQEIEEAYQRYLKNKATSDKGAQEEAAATGDDVKTSFRMSMPDE